MRLPRIRFSIKATMVLVALSALVPWWWRMDRLSKRYALLASHHAIQARSFARGPEQIKLANGTTIEDRDDLVSAFERIRDYHLKLATKYADASRYPWTRLDPDPPEPRGAVSFQAPP